MTWHKQITKARRTAGLNKTEFATAVGVSSPTVTDWESGKIKNIDGENLLKACDVLNVSPYWLMRGEKYCDDHSTSELKIDTSEIVTLITLYGQSTIKGRQLILESAQEAPKADIAHRNSATND